MTVGMCPVGNMQAVSRGLHCRGVAERRGKLVKSQHCAATVTTIVDCRSPIFENPRSPDARFVSRILTVTHEHEPGSQPSGCTWRAICPQLPSLNGLEPRSKHEKQNAPRIRRNR